MENTQARQPVRGLTFEDVWAAILEIGELIKDTGRAMKETDRRLKETDREVKETARVVREISKETDRRLKETDRAIKETDRQLKETDREVKETAREVKETTRVVREISKEVGGISNRLGEVAQCFFGSDLWRHFDGFEYEFQRLYPYLPLFNEKNEPIGDIDITLLNGEYAMAIEVKTHLKRKNVEYHIKRLEQIKKFPPAQYVGKKLLGGVAALMIDQDAKDFADERGIYVIEQSGEAVRLAPRPEGFNATEW
jgi:gas vesicle protein